jgi:hypothetical protein
LFDTTFVIITYITYQRIENGLGGPDWMLINWNWQKAQPLQISKIEAGGQPLYHCSYCPADPSLLCVTGKNTLRYFRIEESSSALKVIETMLDDRDDEDYLCHAWIAYVIVAHHFIIHYRSLILSFLYWL